MFTANGGGGGGSSNYFSSGTATKAAPFVQVPKAKKATPKRVVPRAVPRAPAAPRPPSGGGGVSSGGGFSGGVGSNASGRISSKAPPPPAKPAAPPISPAEAEKKYLLTDTAYKAQNDALTKAARDYLTQKNSQENQYNLQYTTNLNELNKQQGIDYGNTEADYAARGMGMGSGAAQKALADLVNQYKTRSGQLLTDKNSYLGNLGSAYTNFLSDQDINRAKYKQEALARRAAQLGL